MLAEGHIHARRYPIIFVWSEVRIARQRINNRIVQEATVMQSVLSTVLGGNTAHRNLQNLLKKVANSD